MYIRKCITRGRGPKELLYTRSVCIPIYILYTAAHAPVTMALGLRPAGIYRNSGSGLYIIIAADTSLRTGAAAVR